MLPERLYLSWALSNAAHMLSFTMAAEMVPEELEGTSAAITNGCMFLVSGIFIALPGYLLPEASSYGASDFQTALMPIWIINVAALAICALFLKDTFKKQLG